MMPRRWSILLILFLARTTMAFQFQAAAALAPLFMSRYGVGFGHVGILIGVYLAPGIAIALPGGAIGARFGERWTVVAAMAGMAAGGVAMALAPSWELQLAGRALAGTGGVVLNVVMAKMVTDWFAGREIATAMGIYVNSWPVGIAAALMILPALAGGGLEIALGAVTAAVLGGLLLVAQYQPLARSGAGEVAGQPDADASGRALSRKEKLGTW